MTWGLIAMLQHLSALLFAGFALIGTAVWLRREGAGIGALTLAILYSPVAFVAQGIGSVVFTGCFIGCGEPDRVGGALVIGASVLLPLAVAAVRATSLVPTSDNAPSVASRPWEYPAGP